jgi:hypothetical protein
VTAALITVLLILVGLPLLAWWIGGRSVWGRLKPGRGPDPWGDFVRRHRLTPAEQTQVSSAVNRGRPLDGERLRAAAVDLARESLTQLDVGGRGGSRAQRIVFLLAVVWFVGLVANVVFALVTGGLSDVPWAGVLTIVAVVVIPVVQRQKMQRAIRVNSGPPAEPGSDRPRPPAQRE